ncbi:hypothetical protein [Parapedobacter sp. 10938]|uniref:hypothetical protein n=1 Tax=Parapedobacter flavus TaxID=3110225 RepID=UPI002DB9A0FA|nr:hypothetical protein [Parapedobacter sp. 10938]MEC3878931.1 hypothetical protein [Parapedobacter sp. 10938]
MKTTSKKLTTAATLLFSLGVLAVNAQVTPVTPTTTNARLFCNGSDLNLGAPPTPGTEWMVRYSETSGNETPEITLTLTGGTSIPAAELESGYYYISTVGDASNPEICESEWVEVPVYVFEPLTVSFTAADYCIEDASTQNFTATVESDDEYGNVAYQWYTVDGTTETAIPGATSATYAPDTEIAAGTTTTYRLRAGYSVGELTYCSDTDEQGVTVLETPGTPVITITGEAPGETL